MKRLALVITLACALFAIAGTSSASADPSGNETCGGDFVFDWWQYQPGITTWKFRGAYFCGDNKTITWEIQHTTDGGMHWADWPDEFGFRSGPGCNDFNGCTKTFTLFSWNPNCSSGSYRVHVWGSDWDKPSSMQGAGKVCNGDVFVE